MCSLHVSQAFCLARTRRLACGVLFVGIIEAFGAVIRRVAIPDLPMSEELWKRHLVASGFSPDDASEIIDGAMSVTRWVDAGASPHAAHLLAESHRISWFTIDGLEKLSVFLSGALAGTSLADIIFIVALARVMHVL